MARDHAPRSIAANLVYVHGIKTAAKIKLPVHLVGGQFYYAAWTDTIPPYTPALGSNS